MKKAFLIGLILCFAAPLLAQTAGDELYLKQLEYRRDKLSIQVKQRTIDISRGYSTTDRWETLYTIEAYTYKWGQDDTRSGSERETREISDWIILKGGLKELSDYEFLHTIGNEEQAARIGNIEKDKSHWRNIGNVMGLSGLVIMIAGSGTDSRTTYISAGGALAVVGVLINAFNLSPDHYIPVDYAQEQIDLYNVELKRKLELPLTYD